MYLDRVKGNTELNICYFTYYLVASAIQTIDLATMNWIQLATRQSSSIVYAPSKKKNTSRECIDEIEIFWVLKAQKAVKISIQVEVWVKV